MRNGYNIGMSEMGPGEVEVMPGVKFPFVETGITSDAFNAWMPMSFAGLLGYFDELKPVKHYGEYFQDQDAKYAEAGKPGLFQAIMERSNPEAILEFDQLVDEFNADLPRIVEKQDKEAVRSFFDRSGQLRDKKPGQEQTPK